MALTKIKIEDIEKIEFYVPSSRMTIAQAYNSYKHNGRVCDFICNGTLFDMDSTSKSTITYGVENGKGLGYLFDSEGIKIVGDNKISWGTVKDTEIKDIICGSPRLVKNGKVNIHWGNKVSSYLKNPAIRTSIGYNEKEFFMCVSDNNNTIEDMANYMKNNGCTHSILLDGGGSTSMLKTENGKMKVVKNTSRTLANFVMVWLKEKPKGDEEEMVEKKKISIDKKVKECDVIVKDGRTYVQLRDFESEGYTITYENGVAGIEKPKK